MTSFSQWLDTLDTSGLKALTRTRPDAFFPPPPTVGSLATRLALPSSAARAIRQLNAAELADLERLADSGAELDPVDASSFDHVETLRASALVFGPDGELRIAPGALTALPPWRVTDAVPDDLDLGALSPPERRVLDTLADSGGVGTTAMAASDADPSAPIPRLIARGLLIRLDANTVRLPRPVRDAVKGITPRTFPLAEPQVPATEQSLIDDTATAQGLDSVRQMRQLLMALLHEPVALNKDGTVGVRALSALTKQLNFDPALFITAGEAAGLVGRGVGEETDATILAATRDALTWLDAPLSDQWAILLAGWVASPWRLDGGASGPRLLSEEMRSPDIRHARMTILRHGGDPQRILFYAPLTGSSIPPSLIEATVAEGTALGALAPEPSSPLLALISDTGHDVAAVTRDLVPGSVDKLIAQADMTVLAPGPLEPEMASFLESVADLESPGLASVWRVTDGSVKRALDAGRTAEELHAWFADHVLGEVPQGIAFLIDDTARMHGAIRAGAAASYIHSADPSLIATAHEKLEEGALRVLAPTVAVSDLPLPRLMAVLRDAGLQPSAEDAHGVQINMAPEPTLVAPTPSRLPRPQRISPEQQEQIIAHLRSDSASAPDAPSSADTLETLRAAVRGRRHVTVGYVDKNGHGKTLTVLPLTVSAGQVDALDEATEKVVRIALPRITKVVMT
nr:Uncharacterised protein [Streptococcus thermophilus]